MTSIFWLAFIFISSLSRKVTLSCQDCKKSCAVGSKCYLISGNDGKEINEEICAERDTCGLSSPLQYNAIHCDIDTEGK